MADTVYQDVSSVRKCSDRSASKAGKNECEAMPQAGQIAPAVEDFRNESVMEGKFPCQQGHIMDFVRDQDHLRVAEHEFGNVFASKDMESALESEVTCFR